MLGQHEYRILRREVCRTDAIHQEFGEFALGPPHSFTGEEREAIRLHVVQPICLCLPLDPGFHSQLFGIIRLEGLKRRTGERLNG